MLINTQAMAMAEIPLEADQCLEGYVFLTWVSYTFILLILSVDRYFQSRFEDIPQPSNNSFSHLLRLLQHAPMPGCHLLDRDILQEALRL